MRAAVWALHLALPISGLWLLASRPEMDRTVQHADAHFWLVLAVAVVNVALGALMSAASAGRADARLFLVSLVFLASAGFLLLHALATPGVLLPEPSTGFEIATTVGLSIGSLFAVASSLELRATQAERVLRWRWPLRTALLVVASGWALVSFMDLPPLNQPPQPKEITAPLVDVALVAVALYLVAAARYYLIYRRQPAAVLISVVTAFTLLAESMLLVVFADKWRMSWWGWHLVLTVAFGFVAYSAYLQYRREGSRVGLFDSIALAATTRRIRAEYEEALEELVSALHERELGKRADEPLAARLAQRFGLTEKQAAVLDRAGAALAAERDLSRRLAALVSVGERARIGLGEDDLLGEVIKQVRPAYGDVHIGLVSGGVLTVDGRRYDPLALSGIAPQLDAGALVYPITVKGRVAGALRVPVQRHGRDPALLATLANHLSISLENVRLYRELSTLFRQYLSPDVAAALLADPDQAALGGSLVEVTALFADLRGFTSFSEAVPPAEIVTMLNRYHSVSVPCILDNGGTIVQFVGDALLALFNAPARQTDHARRAVRAALGMQAAVDAIAAGRPDWPRFRVGANTGLALVGNIGSEALRGFNAMGDAVNVAARLQTLAEPGQVVIGDATRQAVGPALAVSPLGDLMVKGRQQPVRAYVVNGLGADA
ncbi:MAG TPA: adenylate/guanylate cyclase domain-containing protein [Micromonosporaceae bacterium]|nr:adenylate/guanylate cyclase domain-containing protein [Micromonosporaceae bacterium]